MIAGAQEEKSLGIIIQNDWSPDKHIAKIIEDTYKLLKIYQSGSLIHWWGYDEESDCVDNSAMIEICSSGVVSTENEDSRRF